MAALEPLGLPFAPESKPEELFDDPHLSEAGGFHNIALPGGERTKLPAPRPKVADAACDIVSTRATLDANGLEPIATVFEAEAILIQNPQPSVSEKQAVFEALLKRINGVLTSRDAKYVMMNAPWVAVDALMEYLPGADAPTVLYLAG